MDPVIEKILQSLQNAGKGVANAFLPAETADAAGYENLMRLLSEQGRALGSEKLSPDQINAMVAEMSGGSAAPKPEFYSTLEGDVGGQDSGMMAAPARQMTDDMVLRKNGPQDDPPGYRQALRNNLPQNVKSPRMRTFIADAKTAIPSQEISDDDMDGAVKYLLKGKKEDMPDLEAAAVADFYSRSRKKNRR